MIAMSNPSGVSVVARGGHTFAEAVGVATDRAGDLVRLASVADPGHIRAVEEFALSVAAPVVVSMAMWSMAQARRQGISRVYFASRDGYLVWRAAQDLAPRLGWDLDLRYLYCSRQSMVGAAVCGGGLDLLDVALSSSDHSISVTTGMRRLGTAPLEIAEELIAAGFERDSWDITLSPGECARLRDAIRSVMNRHQPAEALLHSEPLRAYLRQEGLEDGVRFAFFDLGQRQTLLRCLELLLPASQPAPHGLYLLRAPDACFLERSSIDVLLSDVSHTEKHQFHSTGIVSLLETVLSANHGSTLSYRTTSERKSEPVFGVDNPLLSAWGWEQYVSQIDVFVQSFPAEQVVDDPISSAPMALLEATESFWFEPTREQASMLSAFPFEDGWGTDAHSLALARPIGVREVPLMIRNRLRSRYRHEWVSGSIALSPPAVSKVLSLFG
jgi:hypothetical protein